MKNAWKFVVAGVLAAVLVGLAYVVAVRQSSASLPQPHDFASWLAANTLGVVVLLVTAALGLFILQRSGSLSAGLAQLLDVRLSRLPDLYQRVPLYRYREEPHRGAGKGALTDPMD